uniref:Secreted protein n=1 Tax=Arundo donax TaxID=35708 RepID=A0A0A9BDZ8_ARUDO
MGSTGWWRTGRRILAFVAFFPSFASTMGTSSEDHVHPLLQHRGPHQRPGDPRRRRRKGVGGGARGHSRS